MVKRRENNKYYFSVEGYTEKWYLDWLCEEIRKCEKAAFTASADTKIEKNPVKRVKGMNVRNKIQIWHLSDYESESQQHTTEFINTMDSMKNAEKLGKQIKYHFGYSNLTFDLWIVLHKKALNSSIPDRKNYLSHINEIFGENFASMSKYKEEDNFKKCLSKLTLDDVIKAIYNAEKIMQINKDTYRPIEYRGFTYYDENPSMAIHEIIKQILKECKIINE